MSSKREVTRTSIRVRTAMAVQAREQGRYLGGRPPYGYLLGDAGPHPNKAHAAWGRRTRRLEPDPETAHVVRWVFAQRLAGHSVARIARALNEAGIPCPSAADPGRNPHRPGTGWTLGTVTTIWPTRGRGPSGVESAAHRQGPRRSRRCQPGAQAGARWNLPDGWVISRTARARGAGQRGRLHRRPGHPCCPRAVALRDIGAPEGGGTCWPGCWCAGRAAGGWNRRGLTAGPPTGAATGIPVRRARPGTARERLRP